MQRNYVKLIGRLGQDAELKTTAKGHAYALFSLAVNEPYKDSVGAWSQTTTWFDVQCWGRTVAFAQTLTKGTHVLIEGRIDISKYTDDGESKTKTWIKATTILRLASKDQPASEDEENIAAATSDPPAKEMEDVPF